MHIASINRVCVCCVQTKRVKVYDRIVFWKVTLVMKLKKDRAFKGMQYRPGWKAVRRMADACETIFSKA